MPSGLSTYVFSPAWAQDRLCILLFISATYWKHNHRHVCKWWACPSCPCSCETFLLSNRPLQTMPSKSRLFSCQTSWRGERLVRWPMDFKGSWNWGHYSPFSSYRSFSWCCFCWLSLTPAAAAALWGAGEMLQARVPGIMKGSEMIWNMCSSLKMGFLWLMQETIIVQKTWEVNR